MSMSFALGLPASLPQQRQIPRSAAVASSRAARLASASPSPRASFGSSARRAFFRGESALVLSGCEPRAADRRSKWAAPLPGTSPARTFVVEAASSNAAGSGSVPKRVQLLQSLPNSLRRWGHVGFWSQLGLCSISTTILLFSRAFQDPYAAGQQAAAATSGVAGLSSAVLGLGCAFLSMVWQYGFVRLARKIRKREAALVQDQSSAAGLLPQLPEVLQGEYDKSRAEVLRSIKIGIFVNLVGMFLTLLGAEATIGVLLGKALAQGVVNPWGGAPGRFVQALDIFTVQANTNTLFSHFVGLSVGLWLLNKLAAVRPPAPQAP